MGDRNARAVTRRQMLAALAATAAAGGPGEPASAAWPGGERSTSPRVPGGEAQAPRRWGVQLYTVRDQIAADAQATLKRIAAIGYTELEVLQPTLATVAPIASSLGLSIASVHLDGATAKGDGSLRSRIFMASPGCQALLNRHRALYSARHC